MLLQITLKHKGTAITGSNVDYGNVIGVVVTSYTPSGISRVGQPLHMWCHMSGFYCGNTHNYSACSYLTGKKKARNVASSCPTLQAKQVATCPCSNSTHAPTEYGHGDCCSVCVQGVIGAQNSSKIQIFKFVYNDIWVCLPFS